MSGTAGRVAVLGLGIIGARAAARISESGRELACWSRTKKGVPGEVATAAEAVRGAEIVAIYLKDAPALRQVMEEVAGELAPGQIVLNHATVDLETTHWLAKFCENRGCRFLDAPFTGSKIASGAGQLVYYIGGDAGLAAEVAEYLALTSRKTLFCGEVGSATVVKLATNLISACTVQALAEGLAIAVRHGVPGGSFMDAVAENACSSTLSGMKLPSMAAGDFDTHFSLDNMAKDSRYAIAAAEAVGLETPAIRTVSERMTNLSNSGLGDLDFSALAKPYLSTPLV